MIAMVIAAIINIILDLIFVGQFHMNVAGAQLRNVTLGEARSMLKDVLMAQEEKGDEVKG